MSDRIPTIADVCSAIAEGRLVAASDGSIYQVSALELRRYFNKRHSAFALALTHALCSVCPDSDEYAQQDLCSSGL